MRGEGHAVLLTSSKGVHEGGVLGSCRGRRLLRFAHFGVTLSKLEADGLGHVGVKPHALLQEKRCAG